MRNFTPKIIAIASLLAAVPLSSAYAVHRHRVEPQAMSVEARAVLDQLQGVKQGIVEARDAKAITPEQEHDLMMRADSIHRSATDGGTTKVCSARSRAWISNCKMIQAAASTSATAPMAAIIPTADAGRQ